jgi:hypothetical protein
MQFTTRSGFQGRPASLSICQTDKAVCSSGTLCKRSHRGARGAEVRVGRVLAKFRKVNQEGTISSVANLLTCPPNVLPKTSGLNRQGSASSSGSTPLIASLSASDQDLTSCSKRAVQSIQSDSERTRFELTLGNPLTKYKAHKVDPFKISSAEALFPPLPPLAPKPAVKLSTGLLTDPVSIVGSKGIQLTLLSALLP